MSRPPGVSAGCSCPSLSVMQPCYDRTIGYVCLSSRQPVAAEVPLCRFLAANQFVEVASLAVRSPVLVHECKVAFLEFLEELVPGYFLQRIIFALRSSWKLQTNHSDVIVASGALDASRLTAALFGPSADRFAIGDRKSTRLNSSHPSISYAVFCL